MSAEPTQQVLGQPRQAPAQTVSEEAGAHNRETQAIAGCGTLATLPSICCRCSNPSRDSPGKKGQIRRSQMAQFAAEAFRSPQTWPFCRASSIAMSFLCLARRVSQIQMQPIHRFSFIGKL